MTTKTQERTTDMQAAGEGGLKHLLSTDQVKKRFNEILGPRRGAQFISSIITVWGNSKQLKDCDPQTILGAAAQAAALDLPILPTLGQAAIVPYKTSAQFQIMTKGIVQLAHRSGKYKKINLVPVYEGQLVSFDQFKNDIKLDQTLKCSDKIEGFYFRFELLNGYIHEAYWSIPRALAHGLKFSKSFQYGSGLWTEDPLFPTRKGERGQEIDLKALKELVATEKVFVTYGSGSFSMCAKTAVKNELMKWGPLSSDMQDAFTADQARILPDGTKEYIDTTDVVEGATAEDRSMPKRASEKKKEAAAPAALPAPEGGDKPAKWVGPGTVIRIAETEISGKEADVVTFKASGEETKFYTSQKEVVDALRPFLDKENAVCLSADTVAGKNWIVEFKKA